MLELTPQPMLTQEMLDRFGPWEPPTQREHESLHLTDYSVAGNAHFEMAIGTNAVPEPSTMIVCIGGIASIVAKKMKRRKV